jgi:hypothetical protein
LESVQRCFTKRIPSISTFSTYAERLVLVNFDTLELRRLRFYLIFHYKVFNHLTPFDPETIFQVYQTPTSLRYNTPFIQKPAHISNKILDTLFYRCINAWNSGTIYRWIYVIRIPYPHLSVVLETLISLDFLRVRNLYSL